MNLFLIDKALCLMSKCGFIAKVAIGAAEIIVFLLIGGWLFAYDMLTVKDGHFTDFAKPDSIFGFAFKVVATIVLGAAVELFIVLAVAMILATAFMLCYCCWYVVLPLLLLFSCICFGRWLYLKNRR